MNKKAAILLSLVLSFGAVAANANDSGENGLNAKPEAQADNKLTAPVIKEGTAHDAAYASLNGNVAVFVQLGKEDEISGQRYGKAFANGFSDREYTNGLPMYVTVVYSKDKADGPTAVGFYSDGGRYDYKDHAYFPASTATKLVPIVARDHVKENGQGNVIPESTTPIVVASLP